MEVGSRVELFTQSSLTVPGDLPGEILNVGWRWLGHGKYLLSCDLRAHGMSGHSPPPSSFHFATVTFNEKILIPDFPMVKLRTTVPNTVVSAKLVSCPACPSNRANNADDPSVVEEGANIDEDIDTA